MDTWPALLARLGHDILDAGEAKGWERLPMPAGTPPVRMPLTAPDHYWTIGVEHASDQTARQRWVIPHRWPITSSELARAWLAECMAASGRRTLSVGPWPDLPCQLPTYCLGGGEGPKGHFAYVDISACFWSLYGATGLDMRYDPIRGHAAVGQTIPLHREEWSMAKGPRNAAWGAFWGRGQYWDWDRTAGALRHRRIPSTPTRNPYMVAWVTDVLHAVATEAVEDFSARAWLTDAAICDQARAGELVEHLGRRWGLQARTVAEGDGYVWDFSHYAVGPKMTRRVARALAGERIGLPRPQRRDGIRHLARRARDRLAYLRWAMADRVMAREVP